jgi:hypothetical protein
MIDKDNEYEFLEAISVLGYCTKAFMSESEVIQSYCHKSMIAQTWRFKERIKIAKELGFLECVIRKRTKLIRLSEKAAAALAEFQQSKPWHKRENTAGGADS